MKRIVKYWWLGLIAAAVVAVAVVLGQGKQAFLSPEAPWLVIEKPLEKYSFENLRQRGFAGSEIKVAGNVFFYEAEGRKISGQINSPVGEPPVGGWPVVIMIRGYVDHEIYQTGVGTQHLAEYFKDNGLMTLAPDFLGFGESDEPPNNVLEERFLRPVQILELIASVKNLSNANPEKILIWGHSNGGQIALSVLEISGAKHPTSLWAPVSKPFPYSILYYTDESDDLGKALRKVVAGFDALYEADEYSIHHYYDWIEAPVLIHQGTADEAVPLKWSKDLEKTLKEKGKTVKLYVYPGADHNLVGGWDEAVKRDVEWFK